MILSLNTPEAQHRNIAEFPATSTHVVSIVPATVVADPTVVMEQNRQYLATLFPGHLDTLNGRVHPSHKVKGTVGFDCAGWSRVLNYKGT